jgi:hypothetical protein
LNRVLSALGSHDKSAEPKAEAEQTPGAAE